MRKKKKNQAEKNLGDQSTTPSRNNSEYLHICNMT